MLKALIVDDEMYVLREMRQLVDWPAYGVEIVGEAVNGRQALAMLAEHHVDLLLTDLSMPGLSGMEYLQQVRSLHPDVRIVVLTMHQDFYLIQQAMRLGVDDYIAKVQVDKETFGNMLRDILSRMRNLPRNYRFGENDVTCVYSPKGRTDEVPDAYRLDDQFALCSGKPPKDAIVLHVHGVSGVNYRAVVDILYRYVTEQLFYEYTPEAPAYDVVISSASQWGVRHEAALQSRLEEEMGQIQWLVQQQLYTRVMQDIPRLKMTHEMLSVFMYRPMLLAADFIPLTPESYFEAIGQIQWWYQWQAYIEKVRRQLLLSMQGSSATEQGVHQALEYIQQHYMENIRLQDVLGVAAMSRSHFSNCFKEQTGLSFVDYLREYRTRRAAQLLEQTNWSVAKIGEKVGYPDERYFRRVFLQTWEMSPSQYRKGKGKQVKTEKDK